MRIKALSLRQPYAELVVIGKKTIELRVWNTKYRGEFLIHAAKTVNVQDCKLAGYDIQDLEFGKIIGKATLIDVKNYDDYEDEWIKDSSKHLEKREYLFGTKGFILQNASKFEKPIICKGQLNLFTVNVDYGKLK